MRAARRRGGIVSKMGSGRLGSSRPSRIHFADTVAGLGLPPTGRFAPACFLSGTMTFMVRCNAALRMKSWPSSFVKWSREKKSVITSAKRISYPRRGQWCISGGSGRLPFKKRRSSPWNKRAFQARLPSKRRFTRRSKRRSSTVVHAKFHGSSFSLAADPDEIRSAL
jgi:hypothetical protein